MPKRLYPQKNHHPSFLLYFAALADDKIGFNGALFPLPRWFQKAIRLQVDLLLWRGADQLICSILSFGSSSLFDNFSLVRTTSMKREFVKVPSLQVSFQFQFQNLKINRVPFLQSLPYSYHDLTLKPSMKVIESLMLSIVHVSRECGAYQGNEGLFLYAFIPLEFNLVGKK